MASQILSGLSKPVNGQVKDGKQRDLEPNVKNVHDPNWKIHSDYGVKQSNTDDWLRVATEDQTGPSLLEDNFGREKVRTLI